MRFVAFVLLVTSTALAAPPSPEATARKVLDGQIAAVRANDATRRALYDKDALLLGSDSHTRVADQAEGYVDLIKTFGSIQVDRMKIDSLVAGGDENVVWLTAGLTTYLSGAAEGVGPVKSTGKPRVSQVAVPSDKGWKVVASIVDDGNPLSPGRDEMQPLGGATATGPLAPLLASPKELAAALSTDPHTFVLGSDKTERAIGPAAAKKLLASWSKLSLSLEGKVREVETKTYAFAQAHVKWTKGKTIYWMEAMLVAVPGPGGTWKVVGVHYANVY